VQLRTLPVLPAQAIAGCAPRFMARRRSQSELPGAAELYDRLFAEQGGVCAICGSPPKTRALHIDHDHRANRVRGLLCFRCNRWVLTYNGDPAKLRAAADYLERAGA
jgi:formate dehydrogenase maturation protein FdhE